MIAQIFENKWKMFNHAKVVLLTVFVVFAATGIQSDGQTGMKQSNANKIPPGDWGGNGIHAIGDDSGISIELDCATANIENQIRLERRGRFSAKGSFTEAPRGPIRVGFEPKSQPAHFSGAITGRTR